MSAPINDGGTEIQSTGSSVNVGLQFSLRDYFAAAAMQPLVTSAIELDHVKWDATAQHAYLIADAMLKAREAK
jgi:hypothetical protein